MRKVNRRKLLSLVDLDSNQRRTTFVDLLYFLPSKKKSDLDSFSTSKRKSDLDSLLSKEGKWFDTHTAHIDNDFHFYYHFDN